MTMKKGLIFFACCLICPEVFASVFSVSPSDKSIQYLGMIFGSSVGSVDLVADSYNQTLSLMFERFNFIIVMMGAITLAYLGVMSTINTAREGRALGGQLSLWVPIRALLGILLLIPGPTSGYSAIQMFVLWVVLNGIGAANAIWNVVLTELSKGISATAGIVINPPAQINALIQNVIISNACMYSINKNPDLATMPGPYQQFGPVQIYNIVQNAIPSPASAATSITQVAYLMVGLKGAPAPYNSICGQYTMSTTISQGDAYISFNLASINQVTTSKMAALQAVFKTTDPAGQLMSSNLNYNNPNYVRPDPGYVYAATKAYMGQISQIATGVQLSKGNNANSWEVSAQPKNSIDTSSVYGQQLGQLSGVGWIHAGSYYFEMVKATTASVASQTHELPSATGVPVNTIFSNGNPPALWSTTNGGNTTAMSLLNTAQAGLLNTALENAIGYFNSDLSVTPRVEGLTISNPSTGSDILDSIVGGIRKGLQDPILDYVKNSMDGGGHKDHLLSAGAFGTTLMLGAEIATLATIIIAFVIQIIASIMSCMNPAGYAVTVLVLQIAPVLLGVFSLMWTMGASLGVYLPMIPYLIFTTSAFGWLIAVIESVVGAPLIALSLTHPSGEEEMGKATDGLVILLNLFLRPMLIIFGFVMAAGLLRAGVAFVNYGFMPALNESTTPSIFSVLAVLGMYTGILLAIANKSFSLIYLLPNQIMRWMGGSTESFDPSDMVGQAKEGYDAAAEKTQSLMDTANKKAGEAASNAAALKSEAGSKTKRGTAQNRKDDKKTLENWKKENELYRKMRSQQLLGGTSKDSDKGAGPGSSGNPGGGTGSGGSKDPNK